jgi:DNA polymerase III subunit epsilon
MALIAPAARNTARCSDAELLAAVYVELTTTRQAVLQLDPIKSAQVIQLPITKRRPQPLAPWLTAEDRNAHREFVATLGSGAVWRDYCAGGLNSNQSITLPSHREAVISD